MLIHQNQNMLIFKGYVVALNQTPIYLYMRTNTSWAYLQQSLVISIYWIIFQIGPSQCKHFCLDRPVLVYFMYVVGVGGYNMKYG